MINGIILYFQIPSPLPVKMDKEADKNIIPLQPAVAEIALGGSGNGVRSGAMNPEPITTVGVPASPGIKTPIKPCTPNIDWPRPASQRAKSASPQLAANKSPLPAIMSPAPGTPNKADFKWPSPCADKEPVPA